METYLEIDKEVEQMFEGPSVSHSGIPACRRAMEEWMGEKTVCLEGEPETAEVERKTICLGKFGSVVDPWGEELRRQAEAKAERWAVESTA